MGSLINSIECQNPTGSISLISRNSQSSLIETKCLAQNGITALSAAASSNDVESMGRLMEMNADPEVFDSKGRALMHLACATGSLDVVKEVVTNNAYWHRKYGAIGVKAMLGKSAGDTSAEPRKQPNNKAVQRVHPIKMRDQHDRSPLRWAMRGNHYEVVEWLLKHGSKIESDLMEWMEEHKDDLLALKKKKKKVVSSSKNSSRSSSRDGSRSGSRRSSKGGSMHK